MTDAAKPRTPEASMKTLAILNLLLNHFAHGLSPTEIGRGCNLSLPLVTNHVRALVEAGFAERIGETGRIRPSVRLAQAAHAILKSLEDTAQRAIELQARITTTRN